jgi:tetratricopeptide (TPR) repeat protein
MVTTEEADSSLLRKINAITPYLNGHDPKVLIPVDFGPEKMANDRRYGPTVMRPQRYLMLLYFANLREPFRLSFGHNIDGMFFFSVRGLERIAYSRELTHKVKYDRSHARRHFLDYPEEQVTHVVKYIPQKKDESKTTRTDLFALTENGIQFCKNIMDNFETANDANAWHNEGLDHANKNEHRQALQCYDIALRINPNYAAACDNKAWAYFNLGDYDESLHCVERALHIAPNYETALWRKGEIFEKLGKFAEAEEYFDKARQKGYKG